MKFYLYFLLFFAANFLFAQDLETQIDNNYQHYRRFMETNPDSALFFIIKAKKLNENLKDDDWDSKIFYGIGYSYFKKQQYSKAIENFQKAIEHAEKSSNNNILSKSYNQIGSIYSFQNNF